MARPAGLASVATTNRQHGGAEAGIRDSGKSRAPVPSAETSSYGTRDIGKQVRPGTEQL